MKKLFLFILIGCFFLCACSHSTENLLIESSADDFDMNNYDKPDTVTIEANQVIYDENGIKITTDSIESDSTSTYLILNFENNSEQDLSLSCESIAVNNFIFQPTFTLDIPKGTSILSGIPLMNKDLNASEITTIAEIEFSLGIYETEEFNLLYETGLLQVQTNQYTTFQQSINTNGTIIYNNKDIQIISKGFALDEEWGDVIVLLVANQSNQNIYLGIENNIAIANNEEYDVTFGYDIPSEHNAVCYLYFQNSNGDVSTDISSASATFTLTDTDTWKTIDTTPEVTFSK